jgi:HD-GYP domain-containing protein (c-di-GMP phosphodiesterase class II)
MPGKAAAEGKPKPKQSPRARSSANVLLHTIFSYVARIADERNIDRQLVVLADMGRDLIGADRCTVWLLDPKADTLWSKYAHGMPTVTLPKSQGIAGWVATHAKPLITNDPYSDERFDKDVDKRTGYKTKSILALPIRDSHRKVVGVYQAINKMTGARRFTSTDEERLLLAATYASKTLEAAMLQEEIQATQREVIYIMSAAGEERSRETGAHVKRVGEYSRLFGEKLGLSKGKTTLLKLAAPMHDIGKIAIPDKILLKDGKLDDEEWVVMKRHTTIGYGFLKNYDRPLLKSAGIIAYQHHERWDGRGYPCGKKGEEIDIYGRIVALADVYDALGSGRVYRKEAWQLDRILDLFKAESGSQFDPELVEVFVANIREFEKIREELKDRPEKPA